MTGHWGFEKQDYVECDWANFGAYEYLFVL